MSIKLNLRLLISSFILNIAAIAHAESNAGSTSLSHVDSAEKIANRANDLKKIQEEIQSAKKIIDKNYSKKNSIQENLKKVEIVLSTNEKKVNSLSDSLKKHKKLLSNYELNEKQLAHLKINQENEIATQMNSMYRLGKENKIKVILNQQDPQKISRAIVYADYFNHARQKSLQEYEATLANIRQNKLVLEKTKQELLENKKDLVSQQEKLRDTFLARKEALGKIKNTIKTDENKLNQLIAEQAQLKELLRSVKKATANVKFPTEGLAFAKTKGQLPWPTQGKLDNRFGKPRTPGDLIWEGIAFVAPKGSEIQAVYAGNVVFAEWFPGKGLLIIIDHGEGYMTLYAHSQTLLCVAGDHVNTGAAIATVGDSGGQAQSMLYFEIRYQGEPINPNLWLYKKS